jgi:FAD/FMN-containing dehydrogenase
MMDRHPRLIVRCANVADVIAAVHCGRETAMRVAVRGGGRNAGGLGVCEDGLVIALSCMKGLRVEPVARTVRVEGDGTWGAVDHTTPAFGLATPSGIISTTGVGGVSFVMLVHGAVTEQHVVGANQCRDSRGARSQRQRK